MVKLKLGAILDEKPVKMTIEIPGSAHRDLIAYAEVLASVTGQATEPSKLVPHMVARFIASDREFAKRKRIRSSGDQGKPIGTVAVAIDDSATIKPIDHSGPRVPPVDSAETPLGYDGT